MLLSSIENIPEKAVLFAEVLELPVDEFELARLFSELENPAIFGGNNSSQAQNRYSFFMAEPSSAFQFDGLTTHNTNVGPLEMLDAEMGKYNFEIYDNELIRDLPFKSGWAGYFGYELGRFIEKMPETAVDDIGFPLIRLGFYDCFIAIDKILEKAWVVALEYPKQKKTVHDRLDKLLNLYNKAKLTSVKNTSSKYKYAVDEAEESTNMSHEEYMASIDKIKQYILDGDIYQVNFSRRISAPYKAKPIELFNWQNEHNPSPYAAFLQWDDKSIVSASPELFVEVNDKKINTLPIKGTRPFLQGSSNESVWENVENFKELLESPKDKAELNMIVDLERNDIAKICKPGTRKVTKSRFIAVYPTVFHAMAEVCGELKESVSFVDMLKGMFPGGSITGAPKIRSMEIIEELEPSARGPYTGSIGFISIDGNVSLNIAIRTVIISQSKAYLQSGGGIVADSDPLAEWEETVTKARALLAGIREINQKTHV